MSIEITNIVGQEQMLMSQIIINIHTELPCVLSATQA